MQLLRHDPDGPHKLVRIETEGCAVNILIDLHEESGTPVIAVEVEPAIPDQLGRVWEAHGPTTVVVRCLGRQDDPMGGDPVEDRAAVVALRRAAQADRTTDVVDP